MPSAEFGYFAPEEILEDNLPETISVCGCGFSLRLLQGNAGIRSGRLVALTFSYF